MGDGYGRGGSFAHLGAPRESYYERRRREARELAALRRQYDVARRRYGRDAAMDAALDAVEEARG